MGGPTDSLALSPVQIGLRFAQMAECWQQYRVNRATIHYRPNVTSSGVLQSVNLETSGSEVYAPNELALGFSADPAFAPASYMNVLECGGTATMSSAPVSLTYTPRRAQWLYTEQPSTPSLADLRQCSFGRLNAFWKLTPAANVSNTLGQILMDLDVSFRFPMDNQLPEPSETKSDDSTIFVQNFIPKSVFRPEASVSRSVHSDNVSIKGGQRPRTEKGQ
jgi:hypothetical protein